MESSNSDANEGLLHDTEINKHQLMDAIQNGDVETAKQLIGVGIDINFILDDFTPLHAALKLRRMDMLELLLSQPNIDLNISNEELDAPLLWKLKSCQYNYYNGAVRVLPEEFVLQLIRAGCEINRSDEDLETPLHYAVHYGNFGGRYSITTTIHELLKRGADINAQASWNATALHYAVRKNNLEVVCMLLYYNADVLIKNTLGHTPFSLALHLEYNEIARVLSNYYSFLDDDVNYIIDNDNVCVVFSTCTNAEQFKTLWSRLDPELILCKDEFRHCFINCYIRWYTYSTSDWVECLYLILNADITFDLIDCKCCKFLSELLRCMRDRHVQSEDRIGLIYMVLSLGVEVTLFEFNCAVGLYGLSRELEPFINSSITHSSITTDFRFFCPLHAFVIRMETDYSVKRITQLFHDALKEWKYGKHGAWCFRYNILAEIFAKTVAFFSLPADTKNSLTSLNNHNHVVMDEERLLEIPDFPSLVELSRNQTHKYLVQTFRFKQPYQLQDFVKKLLIPIRIKDIILFKQPIY